MNRIIVENIRSAFNVGNIIRTADALNYGVIISGYSPHPDTEPKVLKSSLGGEKNIPIKHFRNTKEAITFCKEKNIILIAAEKTEKSLPLQNIKIPSGPFAIIMGNEVTGVSEESLEQANQIVHIPMKGKKESLNVGQAAAIFARHLSSHLQQ
ncbi:MAG TPA: TrmH family RNA methyltransferase [Candidatus Absconditabacterales bacterium]|nr:TrmH family RNA methyltransferase [Candidatus Absconditabacterales bacterium]HMT26911.1 TrmH family RNA methyltransferase [Candidatus Absconditabacterales bacterium]